MARRPRSTYRLQITPDFDLATAADLVDHLRTLGADWLYLSPVLQAEPGSSHGYDVVDHSRVDTGRGGDQAFTALAEKVRAAGMGLLVDLVPNHMGVATPEHNRWWWEVLAKGPTCREAAAFDIDWAAGNGRLRIPVLGDDDSPADLTVDGNRLRYYDLAFPIAEGTGHGTPEQIHERQHYELVNWRRADAELNYRRFFAVNSLAGLRVEDPEYFVASHRLVAGWCDSGLVSGLRIDHPDGLRDPAGYLRDLADISGGRYVLVEKILEPGEELPTDWACDGTTGYDALADIDRVLVDPAGAEPLQALDRNLRGPGTPEWHELTHRTRRAVADTILRSEVNRLARLVPEIPRADDAIAELLSCVPVYRTYLWPDDTDPATDATGVEVISRTLRTALDRRPDLAPALTAVAGLLTDPETEVAVRFQQTSGMVRAKGIEDCAFYRYSPLTSLTEVGGDPAEFGIEVAEYHRRQQHRLATWPHTQTTLNTHDTKRSADTRARLHTLAEMPTEWADALAGWMRLAPMPDHGFANLFWQAVVGAWPLDRERLGAYALKAAREAGESTGWTDPDADFERALAAVVDAVFDNPELRTSVTAFVDRITPAGRCNSLAAVVLQHTGPGVPDVYQGAELWDHSLVDPDNRRPVDHARRRDLLAHIDSGAIPPIDDSGAAKLLVTARTLRLRRDRPELFTAHQPLAAGGPQAHHLVATDHGGAITLVTRLPIGLCRAGGWGETTIDLPDTVDAYTGRRFGGRIPVAQVLGEYPVALLIPAQESR